LETLKNLFSIAEVALGLGFVIFLHELGHFVLAKWNGVKVEKFSIGFGPTLLGFTRGETEYVLAMVPLGGFVKMLGEGPDEESNKSSDPRAYPNKSVGARMAIISAGVIMNVFLGLGCFVYAYKMGMDERPTTIGSVVAGRPAYEAGLLPGDEIVALDGRRNLSFNNLKMRVSLSGKGQVMHFEVKRPGVPSPLYFDIEPQPDNVQKMPGIGIVPSLDLVLDQKPYDPPAGLVSKPVAPDSGLMSLDRVIAAGPVGKPPEKVADVFALYHVFGKALNEPVEVVVERHPKTKDGVPGPVEKATAVLPPNQFVDFGFRLTIEPIAAIRKGSPAERAGFREDDLIVKVDGRDDFDPMQLPSMCFDKAGKPMTFEVERNGPGGQAKTVTLTVTPDATVPWVEYVNISQPLDVAGLGLAYQVRTRVVAVKPGSPAERAGIKPGDRLTEMAIPPLKTDKRGTKPKEIMLDERSNAWAGVFQQLQLRPLGPIELTVNKSTKPVTITPEPVPGWFHPFRGEQFQLLSRRTPPMSVTTALRRGSDDTVENILSIYAMIRSLVQGRVGPENLGGPIMIGDVAFRTAQSGLTDLVHFLGILSINLAVLNFLPVPPLDGGQMIFLLAEKVRGRPLPDAALIAGTYIGLFLVLGLMVFVLYQDFVRYVTTWF
jgi:regulator of sigma E protease